jgi:hypothetical protein
MFGKARIMATDEEVRNPLPVFVESIVYSIRPYDIPYLLAYKNPLRYKTPWHIVPLLVKGHCPALTNFVCHTHIYIVNPFAIVPLRERVIVSHGPHKGVLPVDTVLPYTVSIQ